MVYFHTTPLPHPILEGLGMENLDIFMASWYTYIHGGHFSYFLAIGYTLWSFDIIIKFWHFVSRKIILHLYGFDSGHSSAMLLCN
jgi:hypothetical protein